LPGLEHFEGTAFHSARWDSRCDLRDKRVAVIGAGASAIQFVPEIQPLVARLAVFQRTPPWVLPGRDRPISDRERWLFRRFPLTQRLVREWIRAVRELFVVGFRNPWLMKQLEGVARRHLEASIADPGLRAKLLPGYTLGCKRILLSNTYYPALAQPNVEVVTAGLAEVRARSLLDRAGVEHPADVLIFGTGFQVTDFPLARRVRGRAGRSLHEVWGGSPQAHLGTTVSGFPNLFILQGPNTGLGHTSVLLMQEAQIEHLLGALRFLRRAGGGALEPRPEAQAAFVAEVDAQMRGTVWVAGGCRSWYLDATGRNSTLWPGTTGQFRRRVARFREEEYFVQAEAVSGEASLRTTASA
jgi:cation diffusion facilitator CzcD-associated flavoprotein CzcO